MWTEIVELGQKVKDQGNMAPRSETEQLAPGELARSGGAQSGLVMSPVSFGRAGAKGLTWHVTAASERRKARPRRLQAAVDSTPHCSNSQWGSGSALFCIAQLDLTGFPGRLKSTMISHERQ